jgi:hypothetical protein
VHVVTTFVPSLLLQLLLLLLQLLLQQIMLLQLELLLVLLQLAFLPLLPFSAPTFNTPIPQQSPMGSWCHQPTTHGCRVLSTAHSRHSCWHSRNVT